MKVIMQELLIGKHLLTRTVERNGRAKMFVTTLTDTSKPKCFVEHGGYAYQFSKQYIEVKMVS